MRENHEYKRCLGVNEFKKVYGVSHTRLYALIKSGKLQVKKNGRRTLIDHEEAERWYSQLPTK